MEILDSFATIRSEKVCVVNRNLGVRAVEERSVLEFIPGVLRDTRGDVGCAETNSEVDIFEKSPQRFAGVFIGYSARSRRPCG